MNYGSVCSGIEAASVAWGPLGLVPAWFAEIDVAASKVLAFRFPQVVNHGDMTKLAALVRQRKIAAPDILVGGTPCQAFSLAGLRKGLADPRGALTLAFVDLANAIDEVRQADGRSAVIIVWENVPGVLSSKDNAFGCFLAGLAGESDALVPAGRKWTNAGCVFGPERAIAWRVQDAQYHGLAQRRRRVFVIASAADRFDPAAVLLEFQGVRRDFAPSRKAGEGVAGTLDARTQGGGFPGTDGACSGHDVPAAFGGNNSGGAIDVATACNAHGGPHGRLDFESETFVVHGTQDPCVDRDIAFALGRNNGQENAYAFQPRIARNGRGDMGDIVNALSAQSGETGKGDAAPCVATNMAVRRLLPVECERLQGFPDDWTLIPVGGGRMAADGPRYKQCGNSMATKVMRWIGRRIVNHLAQIGHNGGPTLEEMLQ